MFVDKTQDIHSFKNNAVRGAQDRRSNVRTGSLTESRIRRPRRPKKAARSGAPPGAWRRSRRNCAESSSTGPGWAPRQRPPPLVGGCGARHTQLRCSRVSLLRYAATLQPRTCMYATLHAYTCTCSRVDAIRNTNIRGHSAAAYGSIRMRKSEAHT